MHASRRAIAILLLAAPVMLASIGPAGAQDVAPLVSPDRIEDVPSTRVDPFPEFDNFAWRAFIALNWPSLTDPGHRGVPDRAKALGDKGPRVWETFKARYELFQVGKNGRPVAPQPWATYEALNPCGADVDSSAKTLATFEPFMDFNQSAFLPGVAANPLVAQNRTYTRYELRINEPEYSALAFTGWSQDENLPDAAHPARLPADSIAVKAAWRLLTAADTAAARARYYVVENANMVDVAKTLAAGHVVCSRSDVALVGLHIVIRTKYRPQGLWTTFEHVDNVPPAGAGDAREPDAKDAGAPYSYFDASKPNLGLSPTFGSPDALPVSFDHPPKIDPPPMQVVRRHPIHASTMAMNRAYWALPGITGTVWEHYMLVASQWPTLRDRSTRTTTGSISPDSRRPRTRRGRTTSRWTRPRKTWSTPQLRPTSRTRRRAACPATRASPTRSGATSSACWAAFVKGDLYLGAVARHLRLVLRAARSKRLKERSLSLCGRDGSQRGWGAPHVYLGDNYRLACAKKSVARAGHGSAQRIEHQTDRGP
jgi:hypothetical protein